MAKFAKMGCAGLRYSLASNLGEMYLLEVLMHFAYNNILHNAKIAKLPKIEKRASQLAQEEWIDGGEVFEHLSKRSKNPKKHIMDALNGRFVDKSIEKKHKDHYIFNEFIQNSKKKNDGELVTWLKKQQKEEVRHEVWLKQMLVDAKSGINGIAIRPVEPKRMKQFLKLGITYFQNPTKKNFGKAMKDYQNMIKTRIDVDGPRLKIAASVIVETYTYGPW